MIWDRVTSAMCQAVGAIQNRVSTQTENGREQHGLATITAPRLKRDGLPDLVARAAQRRNKTQARKYLDLHRTLAKGIYSDETQP